MTGKYTPLETYLRGLPPDRKDITLTFARIEGILKFRLPASAYEDERWWRHETEGNHVNKRAWANAGWRVDSLDVKEKWVRLVRTRQAP